MKKQVLVTESRGETRVAILEGGTQGKETSNKRTRGKRSGADRENGAGKWRVAELYIERPSSRSIVGNIYKGRIDNVVPGLEAAFVDIGMGKNGFLHVDDIVGTEKKPKRGSKRLRIGDLLKKGQEIVVQAVKDPLKTKGPRVSMELAIPGRYMVYLPHGEGVGISRRLPQNERERLRKIGAKLKIDKGGAIIRTAAKGAERDELEREVGYLFRLQKVLQERTEKTPAPNMVFQEADLPIRVVRDLFSKEFDRAVLDDEVQFRRVMNFFKRTAPELADKVEMYEERKPLFERYGVEDDFRSTLSSRVDLPSGGYIIIDYTEAMTVIDVNTGSFTGRRRGGLEDTITKTNLEAAKEVVLQLRLRDIGGIIVIDFIDMERAGNRNQVLDALNSELEGDRTKTYVMEITPLGLVEMTRENVTDGVREIMTKKCEVCAGEGVVLSEQSVAIEVEDKLLDLASESKSDAFLIRANPRVFSLIIGDEGEGLEHLEKETGKKFHFEGFDSLPMDTFAVVLEGSLEDVEKKALPFKKGDEVVLEIEESSAGGKGEGLARVDGYRVSVAGAAGLVGQRKLIRIDEVTRAGAGGTLVEGGEDSGRKRKRRRRR